MGRGDQTWGYRNEHLLSGSVLRLDVSKLGHLPLNVKTSESGGNYNPYNPNAPLTIYASGIRNAYDLVWHSNGNLYLPTNGSAAGGNTPASVTGTLRPDGKTYNGPAAPPLSHVQETQKDFLFRVVKGGYYGHPNPLRGEYVLNGGNPTAAIDPAEVKSYPLGTAPDANYRGYSYDFQMNASPNGAIEYKSNSFNGALKGKLLVVRYSQHKDIITLTPGGLNNDIISAYEGYAIKGFSKFNAPLDLTEDVRNGNIYVSEYGGEGRIVLLKPRTTNKQATTRALEPIADAHVRNGSYAGTNYGNSVSLVVKSSVSSGLTRSTYLKFSLNGVKNVNRAILRLYGSNTENSALTNISAFGVSNDAWTEKGITLNNAPASLIPYLSSVSVNNQLKYYEFDVTSFVKAQFAGDKVVSFLIKDSANQNKTLAFNSRQNANNHPQLVITTDTVSQSFAKRNTQTIIPNQIFPARPSCDGAEEVVTIAENTILPLVPANSAESPKVYPNPVHKRFNIQFPRQYQGNVTLQIADAVGKTFEIGKYPLKPGGTNIDVNVSNLSLKPGAYFLKINSEVKTEVMKLIVQ
ncbi:MAG: DNRLRE domain-containing protein [Segetibacter sp.]